MDIETVWRRISFHQGETFHQKRGKPFTYTVHLKALRPDTTNQQIPKLHFERALELMPLTGPGPLCKKHRGPLYIYAILTDPRICGAEVPPDA